MYRCAFVFVCALVASLVDRSRADWSLKVATNATTLLTPYITPKFRFAGLQQGVLELETVVLDIVDYMEFCASGGEKDLSSKYQGKLVILKEPETQLLCRGELGLYADYNFMKTWCSKVSSTVLRLIDSWEPGILANEHDGNRFQGRGVENCTILHARVNDVILESDVWNQLQVGVLTRVDIDENQALKLFDKPQLRPVRILFSSGFFYYLIKAVRLLLRRWRRRTLTPIVGMVLGLNASLCLLFGVFVFGGTHFVTPTWPANLSRALFTVLFGTTVASSYLLSSLFYQVTSSLERTFASQRHSWFLGPSKFYGAAFVLIGMDVVLCILSVRANDELVDLLLKVFPIFFFFMQAFVSVTLVLQTRATIRTMRAILQVDSKSLKRYSTQAVVRRLSHFVQRSVLGGVTSSAVLVFTISIFESHWNLLVSSFLVFASRLAIISAQLKCCEVSEASAQPRILPRSLLPTKHRKLPS